MLSARNALWILAFSPSLLQASLGFTVTKADFNYLSGYQEGFIGASNVKQLALAPILFHNRRTSQAWGEEKRIGTWVGGNKMSEAMYNLLLATDNITSLELLPAQSQSYDQTTVYPGCLAALTSSYSSLKHLRLLSICPIDRDNNRGSGDPYLKLSSFESLKYLGLDLMTIAALKSWHQAHTAPPNLEALQIVCYDCSRLQTPQPNQFMEETLMVNNLQTLNFQNLRQLIVPAKPIGYAGEAPPSRFGVDWQNVRKKTREHEIFKSGKVCLKMLKSDEIDEYVSLFSSCMPAQRSHLLCVSHLLSRRPFKGRGLPVLAWLDTIHQRLGL